MVVGLSNLSMVRFTAALLACFAFTGNGKRKALSAQIGQSARRSEGASQSPSAPVGTQKIAEPWEPFTALLASAGEPSAFSIASLRPTASSTATRHWSRVGRAGASMKEDDSIGVALMAKDMSQEEKFLWRASSRLLLQMLTLRPLPKRLTGDAQVEKAADGGEVVKSKWTFDMGEGPTFVNIPELDRLRKIYGTPFKVSASAVLRYDAAGKLTSVVGGAWSINGQMLEAPTDESDIKLLDGVCKGITQKLLKRDRKEAQTKKPKQESTARSQGLAFALDEGTRKSHSMAENTQFVTGFFKGISTRSAFSQLVASLYFVYDAMETCFDAATDPNVKALDYPYLRRKAALREDMVYYFGPDWESTVKPSPATRKYVERVMSVARDRPYLLVAHQYTRYLGDLFGGQMMGGMARSTLKLDDDLGTRFYEFDDIPATKPFIEQWYTKLNTLELSDEKKQEIIDEANLVFTFNIDLFNEMGENVRKRDSIKALWRIFTDSVKQNVLGRS